MSLVTLIASALIHSVWQGILVASGCAIAAAALHRAPSPVRLRIFGLGLLSMAVLPVATAAGLQRFAPPAAGAMPSWTSALVLAWCAGVAIAAGRTGLDLARLVLLERRSIAAPPALAARFDALARAVGAPARARLRLIADGWSPLASGIVRPVVLFPVGVLARLDPQQIEALLIHELVHLKRLDPLWVAAQAALEALLFHHPAAWWLSARIREERELATDAEASARVGALPYARALVEVASTRRAALAAAAAGPLTARIERILGQIPDRPRTPWLAPAMAAAAALALASGDLAAADPALAVPPAASGTVASLLAPPRPATPAPPRVPLGTAAVRPEAPQPPGAPPIPDASLQIVTETPGGAPQPTAPPAATPPESPCLALRAEALSIVACGSPDDIAQLRAWVPRFQVLAAETATRLAAARARADAWSAAGKQLRLPPPPAQALTEQQQRRGMQRALLGYERRIESYLRHVDAIVPPLPGAPDARLPGQSPLRTWDRAMVARDVDDPDRKRGFARLIGK